MQTTATTALEVDSGNTPHTAPGHARNLRIKNRTIGRKISWFTLCSLASFLLAFTLSLPVQAASADNKTAQTPAAADTSKTQTPATDPSKEAADKPAKTEARRQTSAPANNKQKRDADIFNPSEEISEDYAVSFPVDI